MPKQTEAREPQMVNRKLIRPNLSEVKERFTPAQRPPRTEIGERGAAPAASNGRRRMGPSDNTSAEAFYYLKQMNSQTPVVLVLNDGEQLRGQIEWYDRNCLKVHREDGPNLLIFKQHIKYLFKQEDE
jgi:host factor-I protein